MKEYKLEPEKVDNPSIAIVVSRFNPSITLKLLENTIHCLKKHGVTNITIAHVPGAFEIPLFANKFAKSSSIDAVITLGAVIRGETPHFDYICNSVSQAISKISLDHQKPVIFGILTCNTLEQAKERICQGIDYAQGALEMIDLLRKIDSN